MTSFPDGIFENIPLLKEFTWEENFCPQENHVLPNHMFKGTKLASFTYSQHEKCNLKIEDFAFTEVFQTLQKLEIKGVQLGSNQLINNLAKHFKNLTNLILTNNEIDSIDPDMIPESVKDMEISKNNLK